MSKKIYELPISRNYVHNWGLKEAIREIMQNAVDAQSDGNPMEVQYDNGCLTIKSTGTNIDVSSLVLGNTDKVDAKYVGTYGEGYKLALLVLLREGHQVTVETNGQMWQPAFRKSRKFKTTDEEGKSVGVETLHIDVFEDDFYANGAVIFSIDGIEYDVFTDLRDHSIAMMKAMNMSIGKFLSSDFGDVLLDDRFKGMMFVNGLFISKDTSFDYGYDFKSEVVTLDRDRKAINYYRLRELTSLAMTSQDDVYIVEQAIVAHKLDVRDITSYIDKVNEEFKVGFADYFMKKNDIDEDTFVGTKKQVMVAKREKSFVVGHSAIAELVNHGIGKAHAFKVIKQKASVSKEIEDAYDYYYGSGLENLIKFLLPKRDRFSEEELKELVEYLGEDLDVSYFGLINEAVLSQFKTGEDDV